MAINKITTISLHYAEVFSQEFKRLRLLKGWTQLELSNELNVSRSKVAKWENAISQPTQIDLEGIYNLFGEANTAKLASSLEKIPQPIEFMQTYTNIFYVLHETTKIMGPDVEQLTFKRCELRLGEFNENTFLLASNLNEFLTGKLSLDALPANGLRPLKHYIAPWCAEIEEWKSLEETK